MAVVNEAYRVLGDPARRFEYDRSLQQHATTSSTEVDDAEPVDDDFDRPIVTPSRLIPAGPARMPWKMMLIVAAVGSAVILITATFNDPPSTEVPDGILRTGSCVAVETNGDVREVACTNVDDITVDLVLPTGAICPGGMGAYRDRLGLGTVCIELD